MSTAAVSSALNSASGVKRKNAYDLKTEDFIKMMITQLQNQDPTEPVKNEELLAQMSQISQLQSNTTMTETLKGLTLQGQIGSASSLIGKVVKGSGPDGKPLTGLVTSIKVSGNDVNLQLDNGSELAMGKVLEIAPLKLN